MTHRTSESSSAETLVDVEDVTAKALDVEKLGRQRPDVFSSTWIEVAFVASILIALSMADFVIGGFQVVLPALVEPFDIAAESQTWPSSVLTLVAGAFLFPFGRLADMIGGFAVFHGGMIWFTLWTIIAGFSRNFVMLVVCRAMEGLGAAAYLTAGISLLGQSYRPGPRKNLIFSLYGGLAPMGFYAGILIAGMAQDVLSWKWYFWIGGTVCGVCTIGTLLTAPRDYTATRKMNITMDWWGVCTTVPGLMLVIYAVTDSAHAPNGWASPQIIVPLILGLICLGAAVYVEGWVAKAPLIPPAIFQVKYMKRMLACLFLTWGVFATFLFYSNLYIQLVLDKPAFLTAVWFTPWCASGLLLAIASGLILHVLPGRALLLIAAFSKILAVLLFALMPENPNYWAWVLPAMIAEAACVDVLWTVSNVYLTTSLPRHCQGLAGALINVALFLGSAFFLAIADVAVAQFKDTGVGLRGQYKGVFWIGVGLATAAMLICCFIRLGKAGCALTVDEKKDMVVEYASDAETVTGETEEEKRKKVEETVGVIQRSGTSSSSEQ